MHERPRRWLLLLGLAGWLAPACADDDRGVVHGPVDAGDAGDARDAGGDGDAPGVAAGEDAAAGDVAPDDGAGPDPAGDAPPADAVIDAAGAGGRDGGWDLASAPLPPGVPPPVRVAGAGALLIGDRVTACSHQVPASGDGHRWCAFRRAAAGGDSELWVIDVTLAAAGAVPACDGSSPACLRLTTGLWTQSPLAGPRQPFANRFEGDTLFFHDRALSTGENAYKGAISVWRPGWTGPRQLAAAANVCYGDAHHALAFCLDDVLHEGFVPVEFDLRAGAVADPGGGALPKVERVRLLRKDGEPSVHATFTRDGGLFVYSAPPGKDAPAASLRTVKTAELGVAAPATVLPDVMDWDLAKDGQAIYYITDYRDHGGTLMVADFPAGTNARALPYPVDGYVILGGTGERDVGVGVFAPVATGGLEYRIVGDRDALDRYVAVFPYRSTLEAFRGSPDLRFTGYTKPEMGARGFIARNDGSGECLLSPVNNRPPYDYQFTDDAGLVFWAQRSEEDPDTAEDGWLANPGGCGGRQRFASRVAFYFPVASAGLVIGDELVVDEGTVTLKYAPLTGGQWPAAGPVRVSTRVDSPATLVGLGPDRRKTHVLYQVTRTAEAERGLFLFALPF